jgi:diguanylate cyclase (GGDEF)-like protein
LPECSLSRSLLDACPYAFTLDGQARITATGAYFPPGPDGPVGKEFCQVFSPRDREMNEVIAAFARSGEPPSPTAHKRLEIDLNGSDDIVLIGSLLPLSDGGLLFLGTLSPSLIGNLDKLKLTLSDFAPFDVLPDFAMMAQINHAVLVDTQMLNKDLSEARDHAVQARREIEIVAMRDDLTGLGNRAAFQRMANEISASVSAVSDSQVHMLLVDLNRFKPINDHFGHHVGDQLLTQIGQKLTDHVCENGHAFRLGGDEFAVLYRGIDYPSAFENASALVRSVNGTYATNETTLVASASGGFASLPRDADDFTSLYKAADIALYSAKKTTDAALICVSRSLIQEAVERDQLETELGMAVDIGQLSNAYQLQFDIDTGLIAGAEALARWHNPRRGAQVPPAEFIPIAESACIVPQIDLFVLEEAMRQSSLWRSQNIALPVSVNLSPVTLEMPGLTGRILQFLDKQAVDPSAIEFEITENAIIRDCEAVKANLSHMDRLGLNIAIDDFGAGQTSLSHLAALPVTRLKLDRCLITDIGSSERKQHVVRSLIELAGDLDLKVTVEGIETQAEADFIQAIGGVTAQGFLFARPKSAPELDPYLLAAAPHGRKPAANITSDRFQAAG